MKRQCLILFTLAAALICGPMQSAEAVPGRGVGVGRGIGGRAVAGRGGAHLNRVGHRHGHGHGHHGFGGLGFGFGGGFYGGYDISELYRQLYNNLPYFALHPPVYYSYPVPRPYGYSPFAYLPNVMTPDIIPEPVEIINPYVPSSKNERAEEPKTDKAAALRAQPQPLVIINPFVATDKAIAQTNR
jgi:hypothetical protein